MSSPLTLAQLRADFTLEEATQEALDLLQGLGFQTTSWQSGSVPLALVSLGAYAHYGLRRFISALSYQGYNSTATGQMLTDLADSHYDNQRVAASSTIGAIRVTGGTVGPPYSVGAGDMVVSDGSVTFRNLNAFTVPAGSYVITLFYAETPGTVGNVANDTITSLVTSYAGVSVNNPDYGGSGTWITTSGTDQEGDDSLRARDTEKWATLSVVEAISDRYQYIARTAVSNCRVAVDDSNPDGPGTVRTYLALADGVASGGDVTLVDNAIDAAKFGGTNTTYAATSDTLNVTATIGYDSSSYSSATVEAAVEAAITAYVNAAPIGGYDFAPIVSNVIDRDGLLAAIRAVPGVTQVVMSAPASDFAVTTYHVAVVGTVSLTMTATS